jgi:hypothetical protein
MDYTQLSSDVAEFAARDDVSTKVPTFIRLAEAEIYRRVRVLDMETDVTLTFTAPDFEAALPTGFQGFKRLTLTGSSNPKTKYVGPDLFASLSSTSATDFAQVIGDARLVYTVESSKVRVSQPPGATAAIVLDCVYFKRFAALDASVNPTNALINDHFDLFLYATLMQLWDWADELEMVAKYTARFDKAIGQIDELEGRRRRAAGEWSRSNIPGVGV